MLFYDNSPTDIALKVFNERYNPFVFELFWRTLNAVPLCFQTKLFSTFLHYKLQVTQYVDELSRSAQLGLVAAPFLGLWVSMP